MSAKILVVKDYNRMTHFENNRDPATLDSLNKRAEEEGRLKIYENISLCDLRNCNLFEKKNQVSTWPRQPVYKKRAQRQVFWLKI